MKTVLVTGAHGFLGRHVATAFAQAGCTVLGVGLGDWESERPGDFGIDRWIGAAVTLEALQALNCCPDVVAHCAGSGSVGFSLAQPFQDFAMTVGTTAAVLEFMRLTAPEAQLIYPSSAAVYGAGHTGPIPVDAELAPSSPYGVHKLAAEALCRSAVQNFGLRCSIVRYFSLYGPGLCKQLLWEASRRLLAAEPDEPIEFFGTGDETRDWLHVHDAAGLMVQLAGDARQELVLNGGSGRAVTVAEVLGKLAKVLGCSADIRFNGQSRAGDPFHLQADIALTRALGWEPQVRLEEGLDEYAAWCRRITR